MMGASALSQQFGVFRGDEKAPWSGFVAEEPGDTPDSCSASMRGHQNHETQGSLDAAIAAQRERFAAARARAAEPGVRL